MARTMLIVGGLPTPCKADDVLAQLNGRTKQDGIAWEWAKADPPQYFLQHHTLVNKILYGLEDETKDVILVKLRRLFDGDKDRLKKKREINFSVPGTVTTAEELINWLLAPERGLAPAKEWYAEAREAAFFAIIAKLLKNEDWANNSHGHHFTQEADLLGQAPVHVHSEVRSEANQLLDKMKDVILLTKGGSQGTTKKGWAIYLPRLGAVMDAFMQQSLVPLQKEPGTSSLLSYIHKGKGSNFRVDEFVDVERVREVCRSERPRVEKSK